nr:immunoglobulin heavy chain junction region [Mus musculus]MBK4198188.1 immunoglobulin heavy chain junction region [Mus musculus]
CAREDDYDHAMDYW